MMAVGAKGVITVTANIEPAGMAAMMDAFEKGDLERAKQLHYRMQPLFNILFIETNPIPVKTALALMGKTTAELRLPLCPMSDQNLEKLKKSLKAYGLKTSHS
jgi:4-hydroxy-tetrahydrodipicolinate synthase